jgi:hypothetical protein
VIRPHILSNLIDCGLCRETLSGGNKNPGCRFGFPNAPGDVVEDYHDLDPSIKFSSELDNDQNKIVLEIIGRLWVIIRVFELTLRNFLHQTIVNYQKDSQWWKNSRLVHPHHLSRFSNVENVQGLTLASVILIFSSTYKILWENAFTFALSEPTTIDRKTFHNKLEYIRKFRNIIAHHGYLRKLNVIQALDFMQSLLEAIDPRAAKWLIGERLKFAKNLNALPD